MVEHMVWIKFKDGVDEARQREHMEGLASLAQTVPAVQRLVVGKNFTDRAQGYTHGLLVTVADRAALKAYNDHPEHMAVALPLRQDAEIMVLDIEVGDD